MKRFFYIGLITCAAFIGVGCMHESPYVLGDAPTKVQLEQMDDAQKIAAARVYMERHPVASISDDDKQQYLLESIDTMKGGVAERMADVLGVKQQEAAGIARIIKVGNKYRIAFSEAFSVTPGPDLVVKVGTLAVGPLKTFQGAHTYDLLSDFELSQAPYVSIYSQMFDLEFARATFD